MYHIHRVLFVHAFLDILILTFSADIEKMQSNLISRSTKFERIKGQLLLNFMKPPRVLLQRSQSLPLILQTKPLVQRSKSTIDMLYLTAPRRDADAQFIARSARMMLTGFRRERAATLCSHVNANADQRSVAQQSSDFYFRPDDEKDMWLEDVDSKESLSWVTARNAETLGMYFQTEGRR
jgi:hypothetical protein